MSTYVTTYEQKNGKTHRVEKTAEKKADHNGAPEQSGADTTTKQSAASTKQGA